jgi:peroxiredoxin
MVLLESNFIKPNTKYNHFELLNTFNETVQSKDLVNKNGLLVVFTCNHCPYAIALWNRLINDYDKIQSFGFNIVAINPNINPNYPDDSPEKMKELIKNKSIPFEYLIDQNQTIAKEYDAICTPDFYLLDQDMKLIYRGAYDDNWKDELNIKHHFILDIMNQISRQKSINISNKTPSIGCSIKWTQN